MSVQYSVYPSSIQLGRDQTRTNLLIVALTAIDQAPKNVPSSPLMLKEPCRRALSCFCLHAAKKHPSFFFHSIPSLSQPLPCCQLVNQRVPVIRQDCRFSQRLKRPAPNTSVNDQTFLGSSIRPPQCQCMTPALILGMELEIPGLSL